MSNAVQAIDSALRSALEGRVFGMDGTVRDIVIALICRGHVLVEGPPGLGKTLLTRSVAATLGGRFGRIQCTADLMPSDITGVHVFSSEQERFRLMQGPVFADVLLVDEINRTSPKTQSALLEAMEERTVTIDRRSYPLPDNFLVLASQNPHEFEGTYPLPESQLDRFLLRSSVDFPAPADELSVLKTYDKPGAGRGEPPETALGAQALEAARTEAAQLRVTDALYDYVRGIASASRAHPRVALGLSTRGALALVRCARVVAALAGRDYVTPDDVREIAEPVMAHRLTTTAEAELSGVSSAALCNEILDGVEVPRA
ncbi:MoxR family ATPase [Ectothiorhodospiraceae bacterium WFHF3C12]|nr:MoxR family ATPase [Ectothiorhodospiraceae bacterium WFHF3C12]